MLNFRDQAPDFTLVDESGYLVTLSELAKNEAVLLAFYPKDFGMVCTKQLCAYQEMMHRLVKYKIRMVGISSNGVGEHKLFKEKYGFNFPLLSDPDKAVTRKYGVTSFFMLGGISRAIFVIGKGGIVLYRYVEPTVLTHRKPNEIVEALEGLRSTGMI